MSKDEINQKYTALAAQAGDLFFKVSEAEVALQRMKAQLVDLQKQRKALEGQMAQALKEENTDVNIPPMAASVP